MEQTFVRLRRSLTVFPGFGGLYTKAPLASVCGSPTTRCSHAVDARVARRVHVTTGNKATNVRTETENVQTHLPFQFGVRGLVRLQHLQETVSKSDNLSFLTV